MEGELRKLLDELDELRGYREHAEARIKDLADRNDAAFLEQQRLRRQVKDLEKNLAATKGFDEEWLWGFPKVEITLSQGLQGGRKLKLKLPQMRPVLGTNPNDGAMLRDAVEEAKRRHRRVHARNGA